MKRSIRIGTASLTYEIEKIEGAGREILKKNFAFLILNIYVSPRRRRQGRATQMLDSLFRKAKEDKAMIDTGCFTNDGKHLIPTIKGLSRKYKVLCVM